MIINTRVTRPARDLAVARHFYEVLLGLAVLASFADHDGFDGVILGLPDERSQLELVVGPEAITPRPSAEDALVLYCDEPTATTVATRLRSAQVPEVRADDHDLNPYWARNGAAVFVDPDGYRTIIAVA